MSLSRLLPVAIVVVALAGCMTPAQIEPPDPEKRTGPEITSKEDSAAGAVTAGAVTASPITVSAVEHYVRAIEAWDDWNRALAEFDRAIEIDPDFALAYFARARHRRHKGDPNTVVADYTAAIERDPGLVQAYRERGEVRLWELGDKGGADDFRLSYEIDPDELRGALAYAGLVEWDDPRTAASIYDRMVERYPGRSEAYLARGKFRRESAEYEEAIADLKAAMAAGDRSPWIRAETVHLRLATGEIESARAEADALLRDHRDSPEAAFAAARVAALSGRAAEAIPFYREYLRHEWADPRALLELAFALAVVGAEREAHGAIDRYEAVKGDPMGARYARAGVAVLRNTDDAVEMIDAILADASWHTPLLFVRAMISPADAAEPGSPRADIAERARTFAPHPRAFLPAQPDLWVWTRLYLARNPGAVPPVALP